METSQRFSIRGRRAVIVGAGGGIGRATARALGELGAELCLLDRAAPADLAGELTGAGASAIAMPCDASSTGSLETALSSFGAADILVYLAAISPWDDWSSADFEQRFDEVIAVNLRGAAMAARATACFRQKFEVTQTARRLVETLQEFLPDASHRAKTPGVG